MYRIDRESRVKKDEDWITHRSAGWRGSKETEEPEPRGVVNRRTDRGSSWSTVDSVPRVPRSSGLEEGGRCSRMETLPPSTRALHARINFLFLSLFFSLFLPLSLSFSLYDVPFDVQPLSNTPNLRLFLARNPVSQGTRRAGRQWETVRLSWRATGSRGDSWFVRSRLSSAILGFARPTLSHPALSRSRDEAAAPLLARSLYLRPATGLSAAREYPVPWGEGRLREVPTAAQAAHQGTTTSPTSSFSSFLLYVCPCDPATTPPSSHPSANTVRPSSLDHRRSVYCYVSSLNRRMVSFVTQSSPGPRIVPNIEHPPSNSARTGTRYLVTPCHRVTDEN